MINESCRVLRHEDIGAGYRIIEFNAPQIAASAVPGQFVHVKVPGLEESALRRPFSIFNADGDVLSLMYKTVGRGTSTLSKVSEGDIVEVMGALGHGFPVKCGGAALLVGGGFGVAPLYFLSRRLRENGVGDIRLFVGGRTNCRASRSLVSRFMQRRMMVRSARTGSSRCRSIAIFRNCARPAAHSRCSRAVPMGC